ncbi:MAG: hypothetical protein U1E91_04385 [Moraxella sp.]
MLFWTIGRIINRFVTGPTDVPMPKWQNKLSHLTHLALCRFACHAFGGLVFCHV